MGRSPCQPAPPAAVQEIVTAANEIIDTRYAWGGGHASFAADFGGPNVPAGSGPRWRTDPTANLGDGTQYVVRHPVGL